MTRRAGRTKEARVRRSRDVLENLVAAEDVKKPIGKGTNRRFIKRIKPLNVSQSDYIASIDFADVIFGIGSAGTGKTYIAVAMAVEMLANKKCNKIILSRPAIEAEGEKLGFLPGDLSSKIEPYLLPIYDVLHERVGRANVQKMISDGIVELCPLGFMRGRTFTNAVMVLDEMQNATKGQLKMALTRMGEGTKAIVTGDPTQSDLTEKESGLVHVSDLLEGAPGVEIVRFNDEDVVRSAVVKNILTRI